MVDFNPVPGSRPYTGPIQTNNQQNGQVNPGNGNNTVTSPPKTEEGGGIFGGISNFFKKIGNAIESAFSPVDNKVKDANFRPNPNFNPNVAATVPVGNYSGLNSGSVPDIKAAYNDLSSSLKANPKIDYFEIEYDTVNKGLSQFISQYKQQIDSNPQLRQQLESSEIGKELLATLDKVSQGQISSSDIVSLQRFIVGSGVEIGNGTGDVGVDGLYGPRTHAGLQQAFEKLLQSPDQTVGNLSTNLSRANQGVEQLRESNEGDLPGYDPRVRAPISRDSITPPVVTNPDPASGPAPTTNIPGSSARGRSILESAERVTAGKTNNRMCMRGVREILDDAKISLRNRDGSNINSAYQAADILAQDHKDKFTEVTVSNPLDLRNLPPGSIVVWDRNPDESKRYDSKGKMRSDGYAHGHIEVIGTGGNAYSDGKQKWGVTVSNWSNRDGQQKYGGYRVFVPNS